MLFAGCFSDPDLKTSLRPEGPPEVVALLAIDGTSGDTYGELPLYCKYVGDVLDDKAPAVVQGGVVCPDSKADFAPVGVNPGGWGLRLVFDELLDTSVETLDCPDGPTEPCTGHINTTLPVTLMCGGVSVAYDGYYYPNGNKESNPVGPSIVIIPSDTVPSGASCELTINAIVKDKTGNPVATGPDLNSFTFTLDSLALVDTDPVDAEAVGDREVLAPDGYVGFYFNATLDPASVSGATGELINLDTNLPVPSVVEVYVDPMAGNTNEIDVYGVAALPAGNYAATLKSGATIADIAGGTTTLAADETVRFVVE